METIRDARAPERNALDNARGQLRPAASMNRAEGHSHCLRCGRRLYSAASRAAGFGSGCRAKIRAAAKVADLAAWTGRQLEQARELIEDAGIVPTGRPGVYRTVSTDGSAVYLTTAKWCGCPASKECYHRAAVAVMQATTKAA